jgi:hypothetical protein
MTLVFKLPDAFVAKHKALLEAWDWRAKPQMLPADELPNDDPLLPLLARAYLEAVPGSIVPKAPRGATVIRSKDPRSMLAVRKYADALGQTDSS